MPFSPHARFAILLPMEIGEHYRTLGVTPDCDDVVIHAAFRALLKKFHPDVDNSTIAAVKAARISEAFAVLGTPQKRAAYDRKLWQSRSRRSLPHTVEEPLSATNAEQVSSNWLDHLMAPTSLPSRMRTLLGGVATGVATTLGILVVCGGTIAAYDRVSGALQPAEDFAASGVGNSEGSQPDGIASLSAQVISTGVGKDRGFSLNPPLRTEDIDAASSKLRRAGSHDGLAVAMKYSSRCHRSAASGISWRARDYCAAYDFAALRASVSLRGSKYDKAKRYFELVTASQAQFYGDFQKPIAMIRHRLAVISSSPTLLRAYPIN
jgi:curved DNA-binding protein CbpA